MSNVMINCYSRCWYRGRELVSSYLQGVTLLENSLCYCP